MLQEKIKDKAIKPDEIIMYIKLTCEMKAKSAYEISEELSLTSRYVTRKYLQQLVKEGYLKVTIGTKGKYFYQTIKL